MWEKSQVAPGPTDNAKQEAFSMRRVKIEQKARREKDDRAPVLPVDPRDPDIVRAKRSTSIGLRDKRL